MNASILKFINQIIELNANPPPVVEEQRKVILGYIKTFLSSVSMFQYRKALDIITQYQLDSINSIELDNELDVPVDDAESGSEPNPDIVFIKPSPSSKKEQSKKPVKPETKPITDFNIKSMLIKHKEHIDKNKIDSYINFDDDDYEIKVEGDDSSSINQCQIRIASSSSKGRVYKKKASESTPPYFYKDAEGYYYGEQCMNHAIGANVYCSLHEVDYENSLLGLISEPPRSAIIVNKVVSAPSNVKSIVITEMPVFDDYDATVSDLEDEYLAYNGYEHRNENGNDSDNLAPDSEEDPDDNLIEYIYEGQMCLLNKETRELFELETLKCLGTLDESEDVSLC
jgi:hypothetical protein